MKDLERARPGRPKEINGLGHGFPTTVYMDSELFSELEKYSITHGLSSSKAIRQLVKEGLERKKENAARIPCLNLTQSGKNTFLDLIERRFDRLEETDDLEEVDEIDEWFSEGVKKCGQGQRACAKRRSYIIRRRKKLNYEIDRMKSLVPIDQIAEHIEEARAEGHIVFDD